MDVGIVSKKSMDLKESIEMVKGLRLITAGAKEVLKDGKVGLSDAGAAVAMFKEFQVLVDAIESMNLIPAELKDLDQEEALILVKDLFPLLQDMKDIFLLIKNKGEKVADVEEKKQLVKTATTIKTKMNKA